MIIKATAHDAAAISRLAILLWPNNTAEELTADFESTVSKSDAAVFLCIIDDTPVGFAQCQLRHDYVEGASTSPVGYLEGIIVREEYRNKGFAKELLSKCEEWARSLGCTEFASNCELSNEASLRFHQKLGFTEANRIICFTKSL